MLNVVVHKNQLIDGIHTEWDNVQAWIVCWAWSGDAFGTLGSKRGMLITLLVFVTCEIVVRSPYSLGYSFRSGWQKAFAYYQLRLSLYRQNDAAFL